MFVRPLTKRISFIVFLPKRQSNYSYNAKVEVKITGVFINIIQASKELLIISRQSAWNFLKKQVLRLACIMALLKYQNLTISVSLEAQLVSKNFAGV